MFYLAAAVSDFYIPASEMPEHKIQSSNGPLQVSEILKQILLYMTYNFRSVPEILKRHSWPPEDKYKSVRQFS